MNMLKDTDIDSDSLVDDLLFLTPSRKNGFFKIRLTNGIALYYRFEGQYAFFTVVLSFDSQGAHAPKCLPKLFYWHSSMLDIWDMNSEDETD